MKPHIPKGLFAAVIAAAWLAQPAMADVLTVNTLENAGDWTLKNGNAAGSVVLQNGGSEYMTYNFDRTLSATDSQDLTFSLTLSVQDSCWGPTYNFLTGVTFSGSNSAFALGTLGYWSTPNKPGDDKGFGYAYGGDGDTQFFSKVGAYAGQSSTTSVITTNYQELIAETPFSTDITVTGKLAADGDGTFTLTLTYGDQNYDVDMGSNSDIDSIVFYNDGSSNATIKSLTLTGYASALSLIWAGTEENHTWGSKGGSWEGSNDISSKKATVTFSSLTEGMSDTVLISGGVVAENVIINDNYNFQGSSASDGLTANTLTIAEDNALVLKGNGTINISSITGNLELANDSSWSTSSAEVITSATGSGDLNIVGNVTLGKDSATQLTGKLIVGEGADLRLGFTHGTSTSGQPVQNVDLSSLEAIELAGGTLSSHYFAGDLGDIIVSKASTISLVDITFNTVEGVNVKEKINIDTLTLNANLSLTTNWKTSVVVNQITGNANLSFAATAGDSMGRDLTIKSVAGYTGNITLSNHDSNPATLNLTVKKDESFNASQITACANSTVVIDGAGTYNMGSQTYIAKADNNTEKGSFADTWTGKVTFNGATFNNADLSTYGNANSTISFSGVTGTLAEQTIYANIELASADASCFDWNGASAANLTYAGKISGAGNMGAANGEGHKIAFTGDVSGWTGVYWASRSSELTYSGNAKTINNSISAGDNYESSVTFKNTNGMTVNGGINNQTWSRGVLNLKVVNEDNSTGAVVFNGVVGVGEKNPTTNLTIEAGAAATFTNSLVKLNNVEVKESATLTLPSTASIASLSLADASELVAGGALTLQGTLTISGKVTLSGGVFDGLAELTEDATLTLFSGVTGLTLNGTQYSPLTRNLLQDEDLSIYFTGIEAGQYYLGYDATAGVVYAGRTASIPEPTTATLSLLALAALASRRRRK